MKNTKSYKFRFFILLSFIFFIVFFSGCSKKTESPRVYLESWEYSLDCLNWNSISQSDFSHLEKYLNSESGYVYLRSKFSVPHYLMNSDLAVFVGKINLSARVQLNSQLLGIHGRLPPNEFWGGSTVAYYNIPKKLINYTGSNDLMLSVYIQGKGSVILSQFVGTMEDVTLSAKFQNFFSSQINMIFAVLLLLISVFHYILYIRWKSEKQYLWYSLLNIASALYLLTHYQGEIPWVTAHFNWLTFNKVIVGIVTNVTAFFATSFIRSYLHRSDSLLVKWTRFIILLIPVVIVLFIPDYFLFTKYLPLIYTFIGSQMLFAVTAVFFFLKNKLRNIKSLLFGFSPVLIALVIDLIFNIVLEYKNLPIFTVFGWQGTIIVFLLILVNRFAKMRQRIEYLNNQLEQEVANQTRELRYVNVKLEEDKRRRDMDIELAAHVQRSFYPTFCDFNGWDVAACFLPLSGVSGDLYDFYHTGTNLNGWSLFDISGHGMAAGLVGMLAKNIISRQFFIAKDKKLSLIMKDINQNIISAKGDIENYMTGILFRYKQKSSTLQLVNAGNPYPIYYKKDEPEPMILQPKEGAVRGGVIGISEIQTVFSDVSVKVDDGDVLIYYTDGITEAENANEEQFKTSGIIEGLNGNISGDASDILARIMSHFNEFRGTTPLEDDITIVVMKKRPHKEEFIEVLEEI